MSFPDSSVGKESTCNSRDPGSISESGRSPGDEIGYPLQYSWASLVAQLVKNLYAMRVTWVQSLGWGDPLEKGTTTHGLQNSQVFWPGEFHGRYSPWGHKESDKTERLSTYFKIYKPINNIFTKNNYILQYKNKQREEWHDFIVV